MTGDYVLVNWRGRWSARQIVEVYRHPLRGNFPDYGRVRSTSGELIWLELGTRLRDVVPTRLDRYAYEYRVVTERQAIGMVLLGLPLDIVMEAGGDV